MKSSDTMITKQLDLNIYEIITHQLGLGYALIQANEEKIVFQDFSGKLDHQHGYTC